jgi:hypothetical protein
MPKPRRLLIHAAAAAVVAVATGAVAAPTAGATTVQVDAGTTTLTLDQGTTGALGARGISIAPLAPAARSRGRLTLPITGGSIDPATGAGSVELAGGLQFRAGGARLELTALTLGTGATRTVTASAGASRLAAFSVSLRGAKVRRRGFDTNLLGARVALTARGAAALNRALHVTAFRRGTAIAAAAIRSQPAELAFRGGATSLAIDPGAASTLGSQGIALTPAAPATLSADGSIAFPIARGRVNAKTLAGSVTQRGGLTFTKGTSVLTFGDLVVQTSGSAKVSARVGSGRMDVLSLDTGPARDSASGRTLTLGGLVGRLTAEAAAALNQAFATTAFTPGTALGTATLTALAR